MPLHDVEPRSGTLPRDREIILYCSCPNEASAAQAARVLLHHGFRTRAPALGGLDAWIAAGYAVEDMPPPVPPCRSPSRGTVDADAARLRQQRAWRHP